MIWLKALPYVAVLALGWLLLQANQEIGRQEESCNTRVETARADSERVTREALSLAHEAELRDRDAIIQNEREALGISEIATSAANAQAAAAQTRIKQLLQEALGNETAPIEQVCLNVGVQSAALDSLR